MNEAIERAATPKNTDPYGLKRQKLISQSHVRSVFTPRTPIKDTDHFSGREPEIAKLLEYITSPGLHALLYGDRGVGKSSLAQVVSTVFLKEFHPLFFSRSCSRTDTFESIFAEVLDTVGVQLGVQTKETSKSVDIEGEANGLVLRGSLSGGTSKTDSVTVDRTQISPSALVGAIKNHAALMVIDEIDRLEPAAIEKISEVIKLLSDATSPFKLLLVGIAMNSRDLIGAHPSIQRCLMQTKLPLMSNQELRKIIDRGEMMTRPPIKFTEVAKTQIVELSAGFPHYTHLLALKAAEEAIAAERREVRMEDLVKAIQVAHEDAEEGLREAYDSVINSDDSGLSKQILIALAKSIGTDHSVHSIARLIKSIFGEEPADSKLRYRIGRMASPTPDTVLRIKAKGVYIINDPRMMCYIRLMNGEHFRHF